MTIQLPKFVATSVVRGSNRAGSQGGVFMLDFEKKEIEQPFDLNTSEIDFDGCSGDRGLRGIACSDEDIFIAAGGLVFF